MSDILHRIGIMAGPEEVHASLTTIDGLKGWWTRDTTGDPDVGGVIAFRFANAPGQGGFDMKVLEDEPGKLVLWEVVSGPDEWIGTKVRFELSQEDGFTIILFRHEDWTDVGTFMHHCSTKWATFLMSLKQHVETGTGQPSPHDLRISNWH